MTFQDRVEALQYLGLTDGQTRFVVTIALHGGYCLRRHYEAFAGVGRGASVRGVLDSLVLRELAERFQFRRDRGYVYHLHQTSLYEAIGQREHRNRHASAAVIARKLMVLDHVLSEPQGEWYATEDDKVRLFTDRFGLAMDCLPHRVFTGGDRSSARTRYFLHTLPIHLAEETSTPGFLHLVTDTKGTGLTQFLRDHLQLLDGLPRWRIVAIAPTHIPGLKAGEAAFTRFCEGLRAPRDASELADVTTYFRHRRALETGEFTSLFSEPFREAAAGWRRAQERFRSYESLYARWCAEGESALDSSAGKAFLAAVEQNRGELVTRVLPYRYDRFGSFAGLS